MALRMLTIVTQWYPPEQAPFGRMMRELAKHLVDAGWRVTVITVFPNHPGGAVFAGYRKQWLSEEWDGGVRICRVWLATSPNRSLLARLATFTSFTVTSSWRIFRQPRPNLIFAVLQPLSLGITLPFIAWLKRTPLVFNLQDLHPDTQIRLGIVRNRIAVWLLRAIERRAYRSSSALTVICEAFRRHAVTCGANAENTLVIGNWIDTDRIRPVPEGAVFRTLAGFNDEDFVVLWAGTLGHVSGAAVLIEAAALLRDQPKVRFLVVGEGPLREPLESRARALGLANVVFRPFETEERLAAMQSAGDVSLVTLAADFAESSVPSKVLAYMAAGRAVVAAVPAGSETAQMVEKSGAGVVVGADNPAGLASAILELATDRERVRSMGSTARTYAIQHLSRDAGLGRYLEAFEQIGKEK